MKGKDVTGGDLRTKYGLWADYRFRAFISYSHADTEWAEKIEARLNRFVMPLELISTWTPFGPPPRRMKPVFRDRSQARAHHDIDGVLADALDSSAALIVVCSPAAAKSAGVNFEVEHFISKGRRDRIFPIIVDGEPGDPALDPFPTALRKSIEGEQQSHGGATPLAADARPGKDGWPGALHKLIAGMAGVDLGLITKDDQRREQFERYRAYFSVMIFSGFLIALLTLGFAWNQRFDALRTQSRYLARASEQQTDKGAPHEGLLLALEALPPADGGLFDRPVTIEALNALDESLRKLTLRSRKLSNICVAAARVIQPEKALVFPSEEGHFASGKTASDWQIPVSGDILAVSKPLSRYAISNRDAIEIHNLADNRDWDMKVINVTTSTQESEKRDGTVTAAAFAKNGIVIAANSGKVDFWPIDADNAPKIECIKKRTDQSRKFKRIVASPDGSLLAAVDFENQPLTILHFDGQTCHELKSNIPNMNIEFVDFIDNNRLATVSISDDKQANVIEVWALVKSTNSQALRATPDPSPPTVKGIVRWFGVSSQGLLGVAVEGRKNLNAQQIDAEMSGLELEIDPRAEAMRGFEDNAIASGRRKSIDRCGLNDWTEESLIFFAAGPQGSSAQIIQILAGFESEVLDFSIDGLVEENVRISVATKIGLSEFQFESLYAIQGRFQGLLVSLLGHTAAVASAEFSVDGSQLLSASTDRTARIWDRQSGKLATVLVGHSAPVTEARFSPDGELIATSSADATARIWSARTGESIMILRGHEDSVNAISFSPNGKKLATASDDTTVRVWDVGSGNMQWEFPHSTKVNSVTFSPDGLKIASSGDDGVLRLWDAGVSNKNAVELEAPLKSNEKCVWINDSAFSQDGRRIAVGYGRDRSRHDCKDEQGFEGIQIFDVDTGLAVGELFGPQENILSVAYSPQHNDLLASASIDGAVTLWRTNERRATKITEFPGQNNEKANSVAFSPKKDVQELVVAYQDGSVGVLAYAISDGQPNDSRNTTNPSPSTSIDPKSRSLNTNDKREINDLIRRSCDSLQAIPLTRASDKFLTENFLAPHSTPPCERTGILTTEWWRRAFGRKEEADAP